MDLGGLYFLGVSQRRDVYITGQIMDAVVQANHVEIISSKISLEGPVWLRMCRMIANYSAREKLGSAPLNSVLFSSPLQSSWWTFHPFVKIKNQQLGQWNRMCFACKVIANTAIWKKDCYQINDYCHFHTVFLILLLCTLNTDPSWCKICVWH